MSACFCASVIPNTLRFSGLLWGVCVSSSPVFVGTTAVMFSLDDVDALADAICFCFRGGMMCCVCVVLLYVVCKKFVAYIYPIEWWKCSVAIVLVCFWYMFGRIGVCLRWLGESFIFRALKLALHWRWRHCGRCRWLHQSRIAISY
jgi:hypothetical protein